MRSGQNRISMFFCCFVSSDFQRLNVQLKLSVSSTLNNSLAAVDDPVVMATASIELDWTGRQIQIWLDEITSIAALNTWNIRMKVIMAKCQQVILSAHRVQQVNCCWIAAQKWYSLNRFRLWAPGGANWYAWLFQVVQVKSNSVTRLQLGAVSLYELNLEEKKSKTK